MNLSTTPLAMGAGPFGYAVQPPSRSRLKTTQEVKAQFLAEGKTIGEWADSHGYRRSDVYRVLNGFSAMQRGLPHQIAVELGIKEGLSA